VGANVDARLDRELERVLGSQASAPLGRVGVATLGPDRVQLADEPIEMLELDANG
jgi:hypothetical protein